MRERLALLRKIVADWVRPWQRLPRDEKVGLFLFVAMCTVIQLMGVFHIPLTLNGWRGGLIMLLIVLISLYFLKVAITGIYHRANSDSLAH